jgi:predicted MFS family arabinose efflux permease
MWNPSPVEPPEEVDVRRLVFVVGAVVFVDTMFLAAIAPLLPSLAHQLHLTKLSAGLLTGSFALGTLVGSLPGGVLAVRLGAKTAVYLGLALLAASTLAFGWADQAWILDAARIVEGFGSALSWAGGLAWLVAETPPGKRGARIGSALGAAVAGALFGPVVGTVADGVGRGPAFSAVVVLAIILIDQARRLPLTHEPSGQGLRDLARAGRNRRLLLSAWLVALPAAGDGALNVLGPLRMHRFGATAVAIGATFLVAAMGEALISPRVGRLSDRRGQLLPLRVGLTAAIPLLACFTLPHRALLLALVIVLTVAALGTFWAPAMAMLSDVADALGLDQAFAAALVNLAWAGGQIIGSGAGGALAQAGGDALPMLLAAGLCLVTLALLAGRSRARLAYSP